MFKKSRLYSIFLNKCPRCHTGNFFVTNNPYDLKRFSQLNNNCSPCNESFRREPGFYFGATYASYGLTVCLGLTLFLTMVWFLKIDILIFLITFLMLLVLLMPLIYRLSRLIWINVFVSPRKTGIN